MTSTHHSMSFRCLGTRVFALVLGAGASTWAQAPTADPGVERIESEVSPEPGGSAQGGSAPARPDTASATQVAIVSTSANSIDQAAVVITEDSSSEPAPGAASSSTSPTQPEGSPIAPAASPLVPSPMSDPAWSGNRATATFEASPHPAVVPRDLPVKALAAHTSRPAVSPAPLALPWLAGSLDVGLPDGLMGGVALRPCALLRAHGSVGTNAVSMGLRAGVSVRLPSTISPALAVDVGHYFEGDANGLARKLAGRTYERSHTAERIGYTFVNLLAGLEFGFARTTLFVHGGVSHINTHLHDVGETLRASGATQQDTSYVLPTNPRLTAWVPSFKFGMLLYFV